LGTGSREENATKIKREHFQAKHARAKAGVVSGSRKENAIKQRQSIRSHSVRLENALNMAPNHPLGKDLPSAADLGAPDLSGIPWTGSAASGRA